MGKQGRTLCSLEFRITRLTHRQLPASFFLGMIYCSSYPLFFCLYPGIALIVGCLTILLLTWVELKCHQLRPSWEATLLSVSPTMEGMESLAGAIVSGSEGFKYLLASYRFHRSLSSGFAVMQLPALLLQSSSS